MHLKFTNNALTIDIIDMPLRPLPTPYKIGVDICHIPRIRRVLLASHYNRKPDNVNTAAIGHVDGPAKSNRIPTRDGFFRAPSGMSEKVQNDLTKMSTHLNLHFLRRLFRDDELQSLRHVYKAVAGTEAHERLFQYVAGRWAAKEAIIKAASSSFHHPPDGSGKLGFHDIKIWRGPDSHGELSAAVISRQRKDVALNTEVSDEPLAGRIELFTQSDGSDEELDGDMVSLSISHENDYAVATALFC